MDININDIINYSVCPMRYKLSSSDNLDEYTIIENKYSNVIKKCIYSYFYTIQNNETAGFNNLKKTFGSLWIGNKTLNDILFCEPSSWRDLNEQKRKKGLNALYDLNSIFKDLNKKPILIDYKYSVKLSKNINISGTFDLVLKNENSTDLYIFNISDTINDYEYLQRNYKVHLAYYSFSKIFNEKLDNIYVYCFNKGKLFKVDLKKINIEEFKKNIIGIVKCLYNNIYYKSPSANCSKCYYKNSCRQ